MTLICRDPGSEKHAFQLFQLFDSLVSKYWQTMKLIYPDDSNNILRQNLTNIVLPED